MDLAAIAGYAECLKAAKRKTSGGIDTIKFSFTLHSEP